MWGGVWKGFLQDRCTRQGAAGAKEELGDCSARLTWREQRMEVRETGQKVLQNWTGCGKDFRVLGSEGGGILSREWKGHMSRARRCGAGCISQESQIGPATSDHGTSEKLCPLFWVSHDHLYSED